MTALPGWIKESELSKVNEKEVPLMEEENKGKTVQEENRKQHLVRSAK